MSAPSSLFDSPEYRRAGAVRQWIDNAMVQVLQDHGQPGDLRRVGDPPAEPGGLDFRATRPMPLPGVTVAVELAAIARGEARRSALLARGEGASWHDVGEALGGLDRDVLYAAREVDLPLGTAAYYWTACGHADGQAPGFRWNSGVSVRWTCSACGQLVVDRGPEAGGPDDCEDGHAAGCIRHAAAIAVHRAELDDWADEDGAP